MAMATINSTTNITIDVIPEAQESLVFVILDSRKLVVELLPMRKTCLTKNRNSMLKMLRSLYKNRPTEKEQ